MGKNAEMLELHVAAADAVVKTTIDNGGETGRHVHDDSLRKRTLEILRIIKMTVKKLGWQHWATADYEEGPGRAQLPSTITVVGEDWLSRPRWGVVEDWRLICLRPMVLVVGSRSTKEYSKLADNGK